MPICTDSPFSKRIAPLLKVLGLFKHIRRIALLSLVFAGMHITSLIPFSAVFFKNDGVVLFFFKSEAEIVIGSAESRQVL